MCYHGHDEDRAEDGGDAELGAHVTDDDQDSADGGDDVLKGKKANLRTSASSCS